MIFTRQKQSDFKLLVKRPKCIHSMFYFSAQLYNHAAWGFVDYPTRAFGGGTTQHKLKFIFVSRVLTTIPSWCAIQKQGADVGWNKIQDFLKFLFLEGKLPFYSIGIYPLSFGDMTTSNCPFLILHLVYIVIGQHSTMWSTCVAIQTKTSLQSIHFSNLTSRILSCTTGSKIQYEHFIWYPMPDSNLYFHS